MADWGRAPVFGDPGTEASSTIRPSAYALIAGRRGRIAVVRTPLGLFLPGGGSDGDETPEETAIRETLEECGLVVQVGVWRRMAIEHTYSVTEQMQFEKRSTFCDASVIGDAGAPIEPDHTLEWVSADEATRLLAPPSHRWAVGEWLATIMA